MASEDDTSLKPRPLDGIRVLDVSTLIPGPMTSYLMALAGAEVIKVERPGGDPMRHMVPGVYDGLNLGKRSIELDLRAPESRQVLVKAIGSSDVLLLNNLPDARRRLGLDEETVSRCNPKIITCSLIGYRTGTGSANLPGHDLNYLAASGILDLAGGNSGQPSSEIGVALADIAATWVGFSSVLLALFQRERTGIGSNIEVAMADAALTFAINRLAEWGTTGELPPAVRPAYGIFRTSDDKYLSLAAIEDRFWSSLCTSLDWNDYLADANLATMPLRQLRAKEINDRLAQTLAGKTIDLWLSRFEELQLPVKRVNALADVVTDRYFTETGLLQMVGAIPAVMFPAQFDSWAGVVPSAAPELGEHTSAILDEWRVSAAERSALQEAGRART